MRAGAFPERLLAFLLAAYAIVGAWEFSNRPACIDYYQFWVVGRAVAAKETTDVYSPEERKRLGELYFQRATAASSRGEPTKRLQAASQRRELETFSTPWFYTVAGALSLEDYDASQRAFQRASLLAYLAGIVVIASLLGYSAVGACLWIVLLLQLFNPFVDDTIAGNVNRLQLLALSLFLLVAGCGRTSARAGLRDVLAGVLLGATLAFKPNLAAIAGVLGLGWLVAGETRRVVATAVGLAAGAGVAVLLSAAFFGSLEPWRAWMHDLPRLLAAGSPSAGGAADGNYALARLLRDSAGITPGAVLPAVLLAIVAAALIAARVRRGDPRAAGETPAARDVLLLGVGACVSLLGSELAWQHYFVAAVPLAMFLLRPVEGGARPVALGLALLGLAMVALQSVGWLLGLEKPAAGAAVMAGGALLLFTLGVAELSRRPTTPVPT